MEPLTEATRNCARWLRPSAGFRGCKGQEHKWSSVLQEKVRNRQAVGSGVWVSGKAVERRRLGWLLPAAKLGPRQGHGVGEVRGRAPTGGRRAAWHGGFGAAGQVAKEATGVRKMKGGKVGFGGLELSQSSESI